MLRARPGIQIHRYPIPARWWLGHWHLTSGVRAAAQSVRECGALAATAFSQRNRERLDGCGSRRRARVDVEVDRPPGETLVVPVARVLLPDFEADVLDDRDRRRLCDRYDADRRFGRRRSCVRLLTNDALSDD